MTFDYKTLKNAERNGNKLGAWNGKPVFATSAANLENKGNGAYYIVYDDDNVIVGLTGYGWKSYGNVSEQGGVKEYSSPRSYHIEKPEARTATTYGRTIPKETQPVGTGGSYSPGYAVDERPVGDVKATIDVEKTLEKARTMSIESLLDGFLPGVDFSVAKG